MEMSDSRGASIVHRQAAHAPQAQGGGAAHRPHGYSRPASMWKKSRARRAAKRRHHHQGGNLSAGSVSSPDEHYLSRSGLRGRKRWVFCSILALLYTVATANLLLTCFVLGTLRFTDNYLQFNRGSLVFTHGANITNITVSSSVSAYANDSLDLSSANTLSLQAGEYRNVPTGDKVLDPSEISLQGSLLRLEPFSHLSIRGASGDTQLLFANSSHVILESLPSLGSLATTQLTTNKVVSKGSLDVAGRTVHTSSIAGVSVASRSVGLSGGEDIVLSTAEASVELRAAGSVTLQEVPQVSSGSEPTSGDAGGYRMCVCGNGRLFLVPSSSHGCRANEQTNPCL